MAAKPAGAPSKFLAALPGGDTAVLRQLAPDAEAGPSPAPPAGVSSKILAAVPCATPVREKESARGAFAESLIRAASRSNLLRRSDTNQYIAIVQEGNNH